jgi:hypothetical protein
MNLNLTLRSMLLATAAAAAFSLGANAAQAATLAGLMDGGATLVWIDTVSLKVTKTVKIQGASLVGMDVRPTDKQLYGLTTQGKIVTIDAASGKLAEKSQVSERLPEGGAISVDFNPAADRLRVIGADGTSLRINVEDGKATVDGSLKYAEGDANKGKTPKPGAAAYTNSFAGTKETALYDIDVANGVLVRQAPPNDGILNTVGALGVKLDGGVAFDIVSDGNGGNAAWLMSGDRLYSVDLAKGSAKSAGTIAGLKGKVMDIAVLPTM